MKLPKIDFLTAQELRVKFSLKWLYHVTKRGRMVKMQIHCLKNMVIWYIQFICYRRELILTIPLVRCVTFDTGTIITFRS